jgi:flagellar basal body-associated protein FliL
MADKKKTSWILLTVLAVIAALVIFAYVRSLNDASEVSEQAAKFNNGPTPRPPNK